MSKTSFAGVEASPVPSARFDTPPVPAFYIVIADGVLRLIIGILPARKLHPSPSLSLQSFPCTHTHHPAVCIAVSIALSRICHPKEQWLWPQIFVRPSHMKPKT
jgi:hypothetical protein